MAVVFEYGCGLQCGGINAVEGGRRVPLGVVGGVVKINGVVVDVEVGGGYGERSLLLGVDVNDECYGRKVVASACHDEAMGVEGFDFARIVAYGDFASLGEGAEVDNRHSAVIYGVAVGIVLPAVAHIQVVAYDTELFRLHAAERTGGLDFECRCVDTYHGLVVAGDIDFAIVGDHVAGAALPHVDLFDALARGWVDDLDGVGVEYG